MPIADVVYNADIARKQNGKKSCYCDEPAIPMRPEPMWFVPPPTPFPIPMDYPRFNPYSDCDCNCKKNEEQSEEEENKEALRANIETQICKLSKRAAAIKKMIDSFKNKNKDVIIKIEGTSYNFGSYQIVTKDEDGNDVIADSEYGESVLAILTSELNLIKVKISELAAKLEEENSADTIVTGVYKTVTQD